ncbi:MAG: hypothetical protein ACE5D8_01845 [Fidelibacterota bacterium]
MVKKTLRIYRYGLVLTGWLSLLTADGQSDRIVIATDEFYKVRRIMVTLPRHTQTIPLVQSDPDSGRFTILVNSIDQKDYNSRKYIRAAGAVPLKLVTTFPDSHSMEIQGFTKPYDRLVSYMVLNENTLIFDVYHYTAIESYFQEKTIPFEQDNVTGTTDTWKDDGSVRMGKANMASPIHYSIMLAVIIVLSLTVIGQMAWIRAQRPGKKEKKEEPEPETKAKPSPERSEPMEKEDHETRVRKVMEERGLTYDEANLFLHVTQRK